MNAMTPELGCCYYPEHWPEEKWAEDAARMVSMGLRWVRIGEFAWSRIEAKPGQLTWDWLDRAVETLYEAGLKIVMGTPTATPPQWMVEKWPDMLAFDKDGHPRRFGSRRHYCFSHEGYRAECARIVILMAERYGEHPGLKAWQTDNEYGCHDTVLSYSPAAQSAFSRWLETRYQTIDQLNAAWGNVFWSMAYANFTDITLPNLTVTEPNPAHVMDFMRFSSDQVVSFNRMQADILRVFSALPVIHNYMGRTVEFDHFKVGDDLDIASWDSYPLGFLEDRSDEGDEWKAHFAQQGDPDFQALHHDLYRAVGKDRWWIMEQQPGPVNWAPFNPAPLPGMVRLWTLEAFAHGAEAVLYFRWRQTPFAQEQMHAGLLRPDSKEAMGAIEAKQVSDDLKSIGALNHEKAKVGLLFDYQSAWAWMTQPQGASFDYFRLIFQHYRALRQLGLNIDILSPYAEDLSGYEMISIPGLFAWNDALLSRLSRFEGLLFAGPRTGSKTEAFQIPEKLAPNMHTLGLDITITHVESLRPNITRNLEGDGNVIDWMEALETDHPALIRLEDGRPVLVGEKNRFYLAAGLDQGGLKRCYQTLLGHSNIPFEEMPGFLRKRSTKDLDFYFNYAPAPVQYQGETIPAAGVFWRNRSSTFPVLG